MKSRGGSSHDDDDEYDDDFTSRKHSSSDVKNNDKVIAMRSKHSVTEQRRRSKINERFRILRDLIPHGDQKRDTASFLLEVIEYVQMLHEKMHKYEGSYQGWSGEPTKLMPWRHSHWRVQSFLGHPQTIKNGPTPAATFTGKSDEKTVGVNPSMTANTQALVDTDSTHDALRSLDQPPEFVDKASSMGVPFAAQMATPQTDGGGPHLLRGATLDSVSTRCALRNDDQLKDHVVEGGTISISSAYSHGLLMTLTQALESSGVDLSEANISIQIDLGKRANQSFVSGVSSAQEQENSGAHDLNMGGHVRDGLCGEGSDQPLKKKLKS